MTGREKFIVIFAVITAVIGGYYSLPDKEKKKPDSTPRNSNTNRLSEIDANLKKVVASEADFQIISLAEQDWKSDPFITVTAAEFNDDNFVVEVTTSLDYRYTGYLQIGDQQIAVIDGMDYEVGGKLDNKNAIVREIHPDHIVLEETKHFDSEEAYPNTVVTNITVPLVE